jgi:hypothetical protein
VVVRQLPRNLTPAQAQRWITDQKALSEVLSGVLKPEHFFELYRHPDQSSGGFITGLLLEKHLNKNDLIFRTLSIEDDMVQGWLDNPATYPEELKYDEVCLWQSIRLEGVNRQIAALKWNDGRVFVCWYSLKNNFSHTSPALLTK